MTSAISALSGVSATTGTAATTGTTGTTGTGSSTNGTSSSSSSSSSLLDPQAFLELLVAQLKYQDPTNPTDMSSFMNQTAMLSQVQTMNSMSTQLSSLASTEQTPAATSLLGKQVSWTDSSGNINSGVVSAVALASTGAMLQIGSHSVALSSVSGVTNAASS